MMSDKEIYARAFIKISGLKDVADRGKLFENLWNDDKIRSEIFSHSFAKAFWGEEEINTYMAKFIPAWQHHLQMMVLEENPLKYLEKFL